MPAAFESMNDQSAGVSRVCRLSAERRLSPERVSRETGEAGTGDRSGRRMGSSNFFRKICPGFRSRGQ